MAGRGSVGVVSGRRRHARTWRSVADSLRTRLPKLGTLMDDSEDDVLAYLAFPAAHRTKLHSANTLECLNKEVKRRADVVGIFPSDASITGLIGAVLLEANDEWQLQHRYMGVEARAELRRCRSSMLPSSDTAYSSHVTPSTPGTAFGLS
jgi:transposase-like protein